MEESPGISPGSAPTLTAHLAGGRHNVNVKHGSEDRFNAADATQRGSGKTPESSPEHTLESKSNRSELRRQAESASPGRISHMALGAEVINDPLEWRNPSKMRKTAARLVICVYLHLRANYVASDRPHTDPACILHYSPQTNFSNQRSQTPG